jgi:hypothetical protein
MSGGTVGVTQDYMVAKCSITNVGGAQGPPLGSVTTQEDSGDYVGPLADFYVTINPIYPTTTA